MREAHAVLAAPVTTGLVQGSLGPAAAHQERERWMLSGGTRSQLMASVGRGGQDSIGRHRDHDATFRPLRAMQPAIDPVLTATWPVPPLRLTSLRIGSTSGTSTR